LLGALAAVLEERLAASAVAGHTGALRIGFGRGGVRLAFDRGRPGAIEEGTAAVGLGGQEMGPASSGPGRAHAPFPGLVLRQLLFGFRSLEQLEDAFPDVMVRPGEARPLLEALFPRCPSDLWPFV